MCRMIGYRGPEIDLHSLLVEPSGGLVDQSWAPRMQTHGTLNADGWGVGWYTPGRIDPARYRNVMPMWSDPHTRTLLPSIQTGLCLSAVRDATPPSPTQLTNTPPFSSGRWLLTHNGVVDGWALGRGEELRRDLSIGRAQEIEGSTDSEVLLAMILELIDRGDDPESAIRKVVVAVATDGSSWTSHTPAEPSAVDADSRLNLLVSDGESLWAVRWGDSLWLWDAGDRGRVIASEPFDLSGPGEAESAWTEVTDRTLLCIGAAGLRTLEMRA